MFLFIDSITPCLIACSTSVTGHPDPTARLVLFVPPLHHDTPAGQIIQWHPSFPSPTSSGHSCGLTDLHGRHPVSTALLTLFQLTVSWPSQFEEIYMPADVQQVRRGDWGYGWRKGVNRRCRCWGLRASVGALRTPQSLLHMHPLVYQLTLFSKPT